MTQSKRIFLIDGAGALVSVLALGLVHCISITHRYAQRDSLWTRGSTRFVFNLRPVRYPLGKVMHSAPWLKGIIAGNTAYALASVILFVKHFDALTSLGLAYFVLELLVLAVLMPTKSKFCNIFKWGNSVQTLKRTSVN